MVKLVENTISKEEVLALSDWLRSDPWLSKGSLCKKFEEEFCEWLGTDYSIFVNSGSSANLLAIACLNEIHRSDTKKVVVPALAWATDLAPVIQLGMEPILCDCNLKDLSVDLNHLEEIFKKEAPFAFMLVSVLGLVPDMKEISFLCSKYNVFLIEDTCESIGSKFNGQKLGTFGAFSTFSFYYSHHASTIEGGMIATNSRKYANILYSMRSHGWMRDCDADIARNQKDFYRVSDFDEMFTFYYPGFNLRQTEIGAFLALNQIKKLDAVICKRNRNYELYRTKHLKNCHWRPEDRPENFISPLAYPLLVNERDTLYNMFRINGIETRPIIAGSLGLQPVYKARYKEKHLTNADIIHKNGLYLPCNSTMPEEDIKDVCRLITEEFAYSL